MTCLPYSRPLCSICVGTLLMLHGFSGSKKLIYTVCTSMLWAVLFLMIRPFSKRLYRQMNVFLAELLWLQLIWLVDWWSGIKVVAHYGGSLARESMEMV